MDYTSNRRGNEFPDEEEGLKLSFRLAVWGGRACWCVLLGEIAGMRCNSLATRLQLACNWIAMRFLFFLPTTSRITFAGTFATTIAGMWLQGTSPNHLAHKRRKINFIAKAETNIYPINKIASV